MNISHSTSLRVFTAALAIILSSQVVFGDGDGVNMPPLQKPAFSPAYSPSEGLQFRRQRSWQGDLIKPPVGAMTLRRPMNPYNQAPGQRPMNPYNQAPGQRPMNLYAPSPAPERHLELGHPAPQAPTPSQSYQTVQEIQPLTASSPAFMAPAFTPLATEPMTFQVGAYPGKDMIKKISGKAAEGIKKVLDFAKKRPEETLIAAVSAIGTLALFILFVKSRKGKKASPSMAKIDEVVSAVPQHEVINRVEPDQMNDKEQDQMNDKEPDQMNGGLDSAAHKKEKNQEYFKEWVTWVGENQKIIKENSFEEMKRVLGKNRNFMDDMQNIALVFLIHEWKKAAFASKETEPLEKKLFHLTVADMLSKGNTKKSAMRRAIARKYGESIDIDNNDFTMEDFYFCENLINENDSLFKNYGNKEGDAEILFTSIESFLKSEKKLNPFDLNSLIQDYSPQQESSEE